MSIERIAGLERRAAVHRALGEAGRLAIVDALLLGDASPSQLQEQLGMASNLLAHHVGVLQDAGLVRRLRSEGDRRRSYLTLVPASLDDLAPATQLTGPRVVFVCTENAARSQLAAALWADHSDVPAVSAGTHPAAAVHPGATAAARRHRLRWRPRTPHRLDEIAQPGDIVVTVCDRAHEELPADCRHAHWAVADPARAGDTAAFDRAVRDLADRVTRLAPTVELAPPASA